MIELSRPQANFLACESKFKAYVAGFGCVHPDTRIHTINGLKKIKDINSHDFVLSVNLLTKKLQYSLTGGSFPKLIDKHYEIENKNGKTVCASTHAILTNCGFRKIKDIDYDFDKIINASIYEKNGNIGISYPINASDVSILVNYAKECREIGCLLYSIANNDDIVYYDMQVLDTNNYIDEYGFIHHNSGKTWAGCSEIIHHFCKHPKVTQGYFAPTYTLIRDIFYPTIEECVYDYGFNVKVQLANKEVDFYRNGNYYGTVICRTIDNPANIVGFKIGNALVDELDILDTRKAELAWNKIIARLRWNDDDVKNGVAVTTTPEGFKFTYDRFQVLRDEQLKKQNNTPYAIIKASTYSNKHNLPDDYIQSLIDTYPSQLIQAYLNGEFVNMTQGSVFPNFDRELNNSHEVVNSDEPIAIGMDFNVYNCSASVSVMRYGCVHIVDEFSKVMDTPSMCKLIKERYPNNRITIYPDSSGQSAKTVNASLSDLNILRQNGFEVKANTTNPRVRDRINATNALICNGSNERKLFINTSKCPETTLCFEQHVYDKNGEPDKTTGKDHLIDAATYPIAYNFPIVAPKRVVNINPIQSRNNW